MVDAPGLGPGGSNPVEVRALSPVPDNFYAYHINPWL